MDISCPHQTEFKHCTLNDVGDCAYSHDTQVNTKKRSVSHVETTFDEVDVDAIQVQNQVNSWVNVLKTFSIRIMFSLLFRGVCNQRGRWSRGFQGRPRGRGR